MIPGPMQPQALALGAEDTTKDVALGTFAIPKAPLFPFGQTTFEASQEERHSSATSRPLVAAKPRARGKAKAEKE